MASSDLAAILDLQREGTRFNDVCGKGLPTFVLTGHSKGGGQAQYAASESTLDAIVFNSDPVNPLLYLPDVPAGNMWDHFVQTIRLCRTPPSDGRMNNYYMTGKIKDVRMVNDPFVEYFYPYCRFPHAPFQWLVDTLDCSANDGHSISTVIRELRACPAK